MAERDAGAAVPKVRNPRCGGRSGLYPRPSGGSGFRRSRYCLTGSRNPSLLVTVVPPDTTRMKSPRGVRLTSLTWLMFNQTTSG